MSTNRSITRRITTTLMAGGVSAALAVVLFAGPGQATPATPVSSCEAVCLDGGTMFGPSLPVALDADSARDLAAIGDRTENPSGPVEMRFISAEAGAHIEVVDTDEIVAKIRLLDGSAAGRIGYVPTGWVVGS